METEKYDEAVRDYEKVCKMDRSRGKQADEYPGTLLPMSNDAENKEGFGCSDSIGKLKKS